MLMAMGSISFMTNGNKSFSTKYKDDELILLNSNVIKNSLSLISYLLY